MEKKKWSIEKCCDYIDAHAEQEISLKNLAEQAGYSYRYFCHWFSSCMEIPLSEYIRNGHLHRGALALAHGKPLKDAAAIAHFKTTAGFCKAFRQKYLLTPAVYQKQYQLVKKPKFKKMKDLKCVCYGLPPYEGKEWNPFHYATHWLDASIETVSATEYQRLAKANYGEVGFWSDPDAISGNRTYFFGPIVDNYNYVPAGMSKKELPAATYAVFTTIPVNIAKDKYSFRQAIEEVKKYVYTTWFQDNPVYLIDDKKVMYEFYPANEDSPLRNHPVEIYVPVINNRDLQKINGTNTEPTANKLRKSKN